MNVYYKATRPNGTDFRTGTVLYEVGERTTHPTSKRRRKDDPRSYLSVSTTPTDCTGFRWPCRLFKVRGVGRAMTHSILPSKRAFLAVDVVEELPAHQVFGPQGEQVVALLERVGRLTETEVRDLDAAWAAVRAAAIALVVRDLIGQHGFTQEHYDALTEPWRKVIGPIHPDDPDWEGAEPGGDQ